jgi:hypothetical protein
MPEYRLNLRAVSHAKRLIDDGLQFTDKKLGPVR